MIDFVRSISQAKMTNVDKIMGCQCHFTKVLDMHKNVICTFNVLKRVFWFEYCCLESANACRTDFVTPNEVHQNSKKNAFYEVEIIAFSSFDGLRLESKNHFCIRLWALSISTRTREHD